MEHGVALKFIEQQTSETAQYRNLDEPSYLRFHETSDRDERDRWVGDRSGGVRIYDQIDSPEVGNPFDPETVGAYLLCVWWTPEPSADARENLHRWYWDEHVPQLMTVPGWLRIRRFKLVAGDGPEFVAMHDLASQDVFDDPSYGPAVNTPWRDRVTAQRVDYRRAIFARVGPHSS